VLLLPLCALVDWVITSFSRWRGKNTMRSLSGLLLGISFSLGIILLLSGTLLVLAIGILYIILSALLWGARKTKRFL